MIENAKSGLCYSQLLFFQLTFSLVFSQSPKILEKVRKRAISEFSISNAEKKIKHSFRILINAQTPKKNKEKMCKMI